MDHPIDLPRDVESIPLCRGLAEVLVTGGETIERLVEIDFDWLPSPRTAGRVYLEGPFEALRYGMGDATPEFVRFVEPWPSGEDEPGQDQSSVGIVAGHPLLGVDDGTTSEVRAQIVNLWAVDARLRNELAVTVGPWEVELSALSALGETRDYLGSTRLYAPTHMLRIRRADGSCFGWDAAEPALRRLWLGLASLNGAIVGEALPAGFDRTGELRWMKCSVTHCDRGGFAMTWSDPHYFREQALEFLPKLFDAMADEFLAKVLTRVIRITMDANNPQPFDTVVPTAQSGLEVLAWAVLVEREGWLQRDARLDAAGRIRLLLRWAGIPATIPEDFEDLHKLRPGGVAKDDWDGPRAVTFVRNELTHPPKGEWPTEEVMDLAWRLSLTYLELGMLRLVGYGGKFASRHFLEGRWVGTVDDVPWVTTEHPT